MPLKDPAIPMVLAVSVIHKVLILDRVIVAIKRPKGMYRAMGQPRLSESYRSWSEWSGKVLARAGREQMVWAGIEAAVGVTAQ
jgi:hypothetical protein